MNLQDFYINESETIITAVDIIQKNRNRNIFTVNNDGKLVGVISQGDIIRGILDGVELHSQCKHVQNTNFIYLKNKDMEKAYKIFKKRITLIPIISNDFKLIDIITLDDIFEYLETKEV